MKVGLIDVDGHNWPSLPLMKLSAWHKARGDDVEWWMAMAPRYDRVYMSKVFDATYSPDVPEPLNADQVVKGGTGYGLGDCLPEEVEHIYPDYSLYPELTRNTAYGFLSRGCPRGCPFCIVGDKEGRRAHKVADLSEWWRGQRYIKLLDPNLTACPERMELLEQLARSDAWVDLTQGLDARLLTEDFIGALNQVKTKMVHFAWDLMDQSEAVLRGLNLYREHGAITDFRRRQVYVLTNYNTTLKEDLYRVYTLRNMGFDPFVMIYDKPHAPRHTRRLQRWVNMKPIFRSVPRFEDYDGAKGRGY